MRWVSACTLARDSESRAFDWISSWSCSSFIRWLPSKARSEEHTSELQSRGHLVCRLLLEKKRHKNSRTQVGAVLSQPLLRCVGSSLARFGEGAHPTAPPHRRVLCAFF